MLTDSYATAKAAEISSVDLSSNDDDGFQQISIPLNTTQLPKKRPIKRPKFFDEVSDSSDNDAEPEPKRKLMCISLYI